MTIDIAFEPYDRHLPLVEGAVSAAVERGWTFKEVGQLANHRDGRDRHERFLHGGEFDVAELSLASYLLYRQSHDDVIGLPLFPRRLFSFSNVWVRQDSPATSWADLVSKVIGVPTFQMSLGVVARRDMMAVEGVDWTSMHWASSHAENVQFAAPVRRISASSLFEALQTGEIDAILTPEIPADARFSQFARRLYGNDSKEIETRQLREQGYAPIMHLMAVRTRVLDEHPTLAHELVEAFARSQEIAWERYDDPGWGMAFWGRLDLESQDAQSIRTHWEHGLEQNRRALEDFRDAAVSQGILQTALDIDGLFA